MLQIPTQSLEVRVPEDIERSFALAAEFGAEAVMTTEDAIQITESGADCRVCQTAANPSCL